MPPKSRPQRKPKLPQEFSPMRPEEEKELNETLFVSLRKIPENGNVGFNLFPQMSSSNKFGNDRRIWSKSDKLN